MNDPNLNTPQVRIDASKFPTLECPCGCKFFRQVLIFKDIPSTLSPNGVGGPKPFPMLRCDDCDRPFFELMSPEMQAEFGHTPPDNEEIPNSGAIIKNI